MTFLKSFMINGKIIFIIFTGIFCCLLTTAPITRAVEPQQVTNAGISIGAILPLSGPYKEYGEKVLKSLILAGNFFSDGQVAPVTLLIEDSSSSSDQARQDLIKLAARTDLTAVIGPLSSEESLAAAEEANKLGIPLLTLTRNETVTSVGNCIFNALPSNRTQIRQLVQYALKDCGLRRMAVLYPDVPSGRDAAAAFREETKKEGGRITHFIAYGEKDADFSSEIQTLIGKELDKDSKVHDNRKILNKITFDALFIPDSAIRVAQILSQFSFYNVRGFRLLGQSGINVPDILMSHRELFEGAIIVDGYFPDGTLPQSDDFANRYYAAYEQEADAMDAYSYDAMATLISLLRIHSGLTREQLRDAMSGLAMDGVRGRIIVNSNRVMDSKPVLITVRDGYPVRIKRLDTISSP